MILSIHIAAGGLAMILGAVALAVKKGGTVHRRSGLLFVYVILVMGASASILAFRKSRSDPNVYAFFLTGYFVGTALTTVRPISPWTRRVGVSALFVILVLALGTIARDVKAFSSPGGFVNGVPFPMHFFMATVMLLAAGRRRADNAIRGAPRSAALDASSLADVLRVVHRGRIVLFDS